MVDDNEINDDKIIGLSLEDAEAITGANIRVMRKDGQDFMGTTDYRPERINVEIVDGKIVAIIGRG